MSLIKFEAAGEGHWAVWEITETLEELYGISKLTEREEAEYAAIKHEIKKKEYLAGRLAIKAIVEEGKASFAGVIKDDCGKPFLSGQKSHISLSHSFPYAGAILHAQRSVGMDIEKPQGKLLKIAHRFLSEEERLAAADEQKKLCVYWCAKETLYKIYGRKQVTFNKNLMVEPFVLEEEGVLKGQILMPDYQETHRLKYLQFNGYIICFSL